ncbi:MAG: glucose sorbosone dehydrogenase, partial [Bryobacterales bacterium]|nr:glucose sorbosone dehydrogenase [Bryobacterales bacterium]
MRLRFLIIPAVALAATAQTPRSVNDGVFTEAQASRGKSLYSQKCASCHGTDLSGGTEAPGLTGDQFLAKWKPRSVNDLFENIRTTMPADKPGSLSREENADVVAHVLASNKFRAGTRALASDSAELRQIRFTSGGAPAAGSSDSATPVYALVEGQPIDRLPPEKSDNKPNFPGQTRAPYHASAKYKITILADKMPAPWGLDFLPGGDIILTHRLPGSLRILNKKGVLSAPLTGVSELTLPGAMGIGLLDVALDRDYAKNHRIFFSYFDYVDRTDSNTNVARATLDEAKGALTDVKVIFRAQPAMPSKRLGAKTGGRFALAPDGTLFMTTGDRSDSPPWNVSQQMDSHLGKVLHITAD